MRPVIEIDGDTRRMVLEALPLLGAVGLYQRHGKLMRVINEEQILLVSRIGLLSVLTSVADWRGWDGRRKRNVEQLPPRAVAQGLLALGEYPGVPFVPDAVVLRSLGVGGNGPIDGALARDWLRAEGWKVGPRRMHRAGFVANSPRAGTAYSLCCLRGSEDDHHRRFDAWFFNRNEQDRAT